MIKKWFKETGYANGDTPKTFFIIVLGILRNSPEAINIKVTASNTNTLSGKVLKFNLFACNYSILKSIKHSIMSRLIRATLTKHLFTTNVINRFFVLIWFSDYDTEETWHETPIESC